MTIISTYIVPEFHAIFWIFFQVSWCIDLNGDLPVCALVCDSLVHKEDCEFQSRILRKQTLAWVATSKPMYSSIIRVIAYIMTATEVLARQAE